MSPEKPEAEAEAEAEDGEPSVFRALRGPFKDIEWKRDPLVKFLGAGQKVGNAIRGIPYPPIQILGAGMESTARIHSGVHMMLLDFLQINNALYDGLPQLGKAENLIDAVQQIGLGKTPERKGKGGNGG